MLRYCEERATLECSVRDLCALAMRSGDLDRGAYRSAFSRMQEGAALHRELQAAMGPEYKPEVPFSPAVLCDGLTYTVSGRADGTGLGLPLAQQVAREHRGSLAYRSRPGHTVFTLLLPMQYETHGEQEPTHG